MPAVNAQQATVLPLREVLLQVEKQHRVSFNYLDETVSGISVVPPKNRLSLADKIQYLSNQTQLEFQFINPNSISISQKIIKSEVTNVAQETLQEVTVAHYLTSGITKKTDGSFAIKPQQFGLLPGLTEPDVLQTMQQIPGIISVDETISNINVRGGTQDQNLFLWNGIRMFQTGHFFGLISAFNPLLTQEIRIHKNGSPAFLGESVSSSVSISTKIDSVQNSAAAEINLTSASFYSRFKTSKKSSVTISGRRSLTDIFTTPTYQNYADRIFQNTIITNLSGNQTIDYDVTKKFYFYDFSAQYQQKIGTKHEFAVDAIGMSNDLDVAQQKTENTENTENRTRKSSLEQQNFGTNLSWKTKWNSYNTSLFSIYGSSYKLMSRNESIESAQQLFQQNSILYTGIRLENHHRLNQNFEFLNGYEFTENGVSNYDRINLPQFSRKVKDVLRIHSAVLEGKFDSDDRRLSVKTGFRTICLEEFKKWLFEPRLQLGYSFTQKLKIEILGEMKSQTMSQVIDLPRDFLGIEKRRWLLSDDDKNPVQQSHQVSVGFIYNDSSWLLTIDNFYKKIRGISSSGQSFQNQLEFIKINGNYTVLGTEILLQRKFERFNSWISYSWNNNEYEFPGFEPPRFPNNFAVAHIVSGAVIYDYKKIKLALGARWFSGKPETTPFGIQTDPKNPTVIYNDPNNENLGDYFQVNFSASKVWKFENRNELSIGLSVQNILNRKNIINRYYRVNTAENTVESVNTFSLARTPNVSIKYSLNKKTGITTGFYL